MNETNRDSGRALVRVNHSAIADRYRATKNEDELQSVLTAELESCGWTVIREAYCRPVGEKARRIDLYCIAPDWFGMSHRAMPTGERNGHATGIRRGFVLGIECKHEGNYGDHADAYEQCRRYVTASVWSDSEGNPLAKPDWFATCALNELAGRGPLNQGVEKYRPNGYVRRLMWRDGCDIMHRGWGGSLYVSVRIPHVYKRGDKPVFTTKDIEYPLTPWVDRDVGTDGQES